MTRWLGIGLVVAVLVLAVTRLSCLAGDRAGASFGEVGEIGTPAGSDLPVHFEVDHLAPGPGPVLTR
jgi:hypothetical protein